MRERGWIGLVVGPAAWAGAFIAAYVLTPRQCAEGGAIVPGVLAIGLLLALAGGAASFAAWWGEGTEPPSGGRPRTFFAAVSAGVAALAAAALVLGLVASLVFGGCET